MDPRIIALYDEYTHAPLERRVFLARLARLVGGSAAAAALLPLLEVNYAHAQTVPADDERLETQYVEYPGASGPVRAYMARPRDAEGPLPSVIVVHENRGLNPHIEDVARRAALEGFIALAPDFLSPLGGTPDDPDAARAMFGELDGERTVENAAAAIEYLAGLDGANGQVGAVGFCWGGGLVNDLAVASPDLDAAVVFYGRSPEPEEVERIQAPLLLHYAGLDDRINAGVPAYEQALQEAGKDYELHMYEGVNHAFHNDTGGERYDPEAARLAWRRTIDFLREELAAT